MSYEPIDFNARIAADKANRKRATSDAIVWASSLGAADIHVRWVVKGLIEQASLFMLFGPPKSGKTFAALDLALHVATGRDWFGRKLKHAGLVVYIARESVGAIKRRVLAHARHHKLETEDLRRLAIVTSNLNLMETDSVTAMLQLIRSAEQHARESAVLIIIDTLARAMTGGDEDKARDMSTAIAGADQLRETINAAVGLVHHEGKTEARGARGSNALLGAVDLSIVVSRDADAGTSRMTVDAQREGDGSFSVGFSLDHVHLGEDDDGDEIATAVVVPTDLPRPKRKVRKLSDEAFNSLNVLRDVIIRLGREVSQEELGRTKPDRSTTAVREEEWRAEYYAKSPEDKTDTNRKRFVRTTHSLIASGQVAMANGWVWLVKNDDPDRTGQDRTSEQRDYPDPDGHGHPPYRGVRVRPGVRHPLSGDDP